MTTHWNESSFSCPGERSPAWLKLKPKLTLIPLLLSGTAIAADRSGSSATTRL
jgi:hypothetical protein